MAYINDYCCSFEDICEKLDNIKIFTDFPSLKSRTIQFHNLIDQLKWTLTKANSCQQKDIEKSKDYIEKIIFYESQLETLISINKIHVDTTKFKREKIFFKNLEGSFSKTFSATFKEFLSNQLSIIQAKKRKRLNPDYKCSQIMHENFLLNLKC